MKAYTSKEWVSLRLRPKILLANILLVFIPVIAMGTISYLMFSRTIEKQSSDFYMVSLTETDRKLMFALNEITTISNSAITQPVIQRALKYPDHDLNHDTRQEINNLFIHHPMIESFSLFSMNKLVYSYNDSREWPNVAAESWYQAMRLADGRPVWSGPGENGSLAGDHPVLIHARMIKDYYSLRDIGSIVITIKPELLEQVFYDTATMESGNVLLVNRQGQIVYDKSGMHVGDTVSFPFLDADDAKDRNYYIDQYQDEESLITYLPSHNSEWVLIAITPTKVLQAESVPIRNTAILLGLFSLLSAFLFDLFFVSRLVRSISNTVGGMRRVEQGVFTRIAASDRQHDESDMLVQGFNKMSAQIEELLQRVKMEQERKKEAELAALVAQINPHFIYNSLESINSMAVMHGNKDISKMVVSLGRLLRISISGTQELISLATEFEHVRHYLNIQKYRFEDGFEFSMELPGHLASCRTLKLIVQPVVENALYHAIEPMKQTGFIQIRAMEQAQQIMIDVIDNGPGFDEKVLMNLWDRPADKKYKDSGVGLRNVHERLRIRFGSPYGLMICSSPGMGSIVRIRIPKLEMEQEALLEANGGTVSEGGSGA